MTQRTAQRFAAAAILAVVVLLGAAAPAQARDLSPARQWLQELWAKAVSMLWDRIGPPALDGRNPGNLVKEGPASDPNGLPSPPPPANTNGDEGPSSDPNG